MLCNILEIDVGEKVFDIEAETPMDAILLAYKKLNIILKETDIKESQYGFYYPSIDNIPGLWVKKVKGIL